MMTPDENRPETDGVSEGDSSAGSVALKGRRPLHACLANERRREVIEIVSRASEPLSVRSLARRLDGAENDRGDDGDGSGSGGETETEIAVSLHHVHVPKLADEGVLEVDDGSIAPGERFDDARSLHERV